MNDAPTIEALNPEIVGTELAKVESQVGLGQDEALALRSTFGTYYEDITKLREQAATITDPEDRTQQKLARTVRVGLKKVRCEVERVRKALKEESLKRGKAIDGFANVLKYLCEPIEEKLLDIELHAERQEAARVAALVEERTAAMVALGTDPTIYNLGAMDDATWATVRAGAERAKADREEAARQAEAERVAREQADRIAREKAEAEAAEARAAAERERKAREEAEAKARAEREAAEKARRDAEAKAAAERAKAEAALRTEREAREKAERAAADAKAKAEREAAEARRREQERIEAERAAAEAKARAEREAAERAARAPDKSKIEAYADAVAAVTFPEMETPAGREAARKIAEQQGKMIAWLRSVARGL